MWGGLLTAVRWATLGIGLGVAAFSDRSPAVAVGALALTVYTVWRTARPLRYLDDDMASLVRVVGEVALGAGVVVATGFWRSPFTFFLASAIVAAGLARSFGFAVRTAMTAAAAVTLPYHLGGHAPDGSHSLQWTAELLLVALVAGYSRRLFGEEQARAQHILERQTQLSAAEERNRIARDLHDSVAQSLAYVAFELDRITVGSVRSGATPELSSDLAALRDEVRGAVTGLRETLHDLRAEVRDDRDLAAVLGEFVERVGRRSTIEVSFETDTSVRPPLRQEDALWRIAQEAVVNAERHAGAQRIDVQWRCDGIEAVVEVADDGRGVGTPSTNTYGITGMRERADAIGARLEILGNATGGTVLRCTLPLTSVGIGT